MSYGAIMISSCVTVNADSNFLDALKSYLNGNNNNQINSNNNNTTKMTVNVDWTIVFKNVLPSVVSIFTPKGNQNNNFNLSNFYNNNMFGFNNNGNNQNSINVGSGFCVSIKNNKLYIVTNYHIIDQSNEIAVLFGNDRLNNANNVIKATVHGTDPKNDIAILVIDIDELEKNTSIRRTQLQCIEWGNSNNTEVGEPVLFIGNPFAIGLSASNGIISAKNRNTNIDNRFTVNNNIIENCIQHTATLNYGNSSGILVNTMGQIIGITTSIRSPNGGNFGVGFAIPSDTARGVINSLIDYQRPLKGWIGVNIQELSYEEAKNLGVLPNDADKLAIRPKSFGASVSQVTPNSPADKAGIKTNDVIVAFNDKLIDNNNPLNKLINEYEIGKTATLLVLRKNKQTNNIDQFEMKVIVENYDGYYGNNNNSNTRENIEELNIVVDNTFKNNENQVIVTGELNTNTIGGLWNRNLNKTFQAGDIITQVNQNVVNNAKQLKDLVRNAYNNSSDGNVTFSIIRENGNNKESIIITTPRLNR